jgi:transposase
VRAPSPALVMSDAQREILESLAKSQTAAHREVTRAKALLLAADGLASTAVAYEVGVSPSSVVAWRSRFAEEGLAKLGRVRPGRGRKPQIPAEKIDEIVRLTQESKPEGETHWSCRSMAKAAGVSPATVQRVWSARGLKPHLVRTFKLSNDRRFDEKLIDVVGVYLNPPDKAVVLCMDEKSQIQALDRTQPSLPLKKGRAGTMTHDYKRNGTTTLFAALNVLTGVVIGQCLPRHRNGEFLKFLRTIDHQVPKGLQIHMILDKLRHPHPRQRRGLAGQASPVPPAFHPDVELMAEHGRTLVPRAHRESHPPRCLQVGARPDRCDRGIPPSQQQRSQAVRMDRHGRGDPRESQPRPGRTRINPG